MSANLRVTQADAAISNHIRAHHASAGPSRVRRMIERPPDGFPAISDAKHTIGPS